MRTESLRRSLPDSSIWRNAQEGHVVLSGLSHDEVVELAVAHGGDRPSRRLAGQLLEDTRGNPLYLKTLLSEYPRRTTAECSEPTSHPRGHLSDLSATGSRRWAHRRNELRMLRLSSATGRARGPYPSSRMFRT